LLIQSFGFCPLDLPNASTAETEQIIVYPNPAQNNVIIAGMYSGNEHVVLLKNGLGQTVATSATTETSVTIDVSKLPIGLYFVIVQENEQDIYNQKLVIEH
jgi:hypothetical protein